MRVSLLSLAFAAAGILPAFAWADAPASKADIAAYAQHELESNYRVDAPGAAVLITRGDEVLFRGARGLADVSAKTPLTADSVFRIGSVSKQFAAAGVLKLVEAGKVSLDDPLSKYVPGFPNGAHITVRELLNHTSGIKSYTSIPGWIDSPLDKDMTTAQLIASFQGAPVDFAPGEGWAYNNSGYILVGAVIEAASGQSWHDYLQATLFEPLKLTHTRYGGDPVSQTHQVPGYTLADGKIAPSKPISMTIPQAAGGLVSTVDDMMAWNRALHEGRVLQNASYLAMITPVGKAVDAKYGFGIEQATIQGQPVLQHSGGIFGFTSMVEYVQGPDISVVVLQNTDDNSEHDGPELAARKLAAAALGKPYPAAIPVSVDTAALQSLEGVYRIDDKSARVLRIVDGKLTSQRIGGQRLVVMPIAKDEFLYEDGLTRFTVVRDAAGAVTGMRFFADGEPPGTVVALTKEPLPTGRQPVPQSAEAIARVLGSYAVGETKLSVFLDGTQLKTQLTGQPAFDLFPESPNVFFLTVVDATLTFGPEKEHAGTVTLSQGGHTTEFKRVP